MRRLQPALRVVVAGSPPRWARLPEKGDPGYLGPRMDAYRPRAWIAVLALVAMLANPLAAFLCCRVLAHDHDGHEHAAQGKVHTTNVGEAIESTRHVARVPDQGCPLVELPPATLAGDQAPSLSPPAPLVASLGHGRGPSLLPAPPSASLEQRSRAPPHDEGRIFIRTCSLLI